MENLDEIELIKNQTLEILQRFKSLIKPFMKLFGEAKNEPTLLQFSWEFLNRWYSSLVSLENFIDLKDSFSVILMLRYNHEMMLNFFYVFGDSKPQEKVKLYFNYEQRLSDSFGRGNNLMSWRGNNFIV